MKRLMILFVMLLLSGCVCQDEVHTEHTISEITICKGLREKECLETLHKVEELLPVELQDRIVETSQLIEIYVGNNQAFLNHMSGKRIHTEGLPYAGITGFGFADKTIIYSMADDYVLAHELAHAYEYSFWYDGVKDNPSSSADWQYAYETEFISSYGQTNVMEFYAECFAMYFRNPKLLKQFCPIAYSLLDEDLGEME